VKPIHLNLAARPYRDYRPVYAAVVVMSLLTAFLMLNNVDTYYRYIHETRTTRAKIATVEQQAAAERAQAALVQRRLESVDLTRLSAQTRFVNAKLAERAFSWSALLDDLESILSEDVRLTTVTPKFTEAGPVMLTLQLESKSPDGMIRTMNRMHEDPSFRNPFPRQEMSIEGRYQFDLHVQYLPAGVSRAEVTR
jgi:Tfp pilus assembly protein PilN